MNNKLIIVDMPQYKLKVECTKPIRPPHNMYSLKLIRESYDKEGNKESETHQQYNLTTDQIRTLSNELRSIISSKD